MHFQDRGSLDPTTNKGNSAELPLPSSSCCLSLHALLPITQPVAPHRWNVQRNDRSPTKAPGKPQDSAATICPHLPGMHGRAPSSGVGEDLRVHP